MSSKTAAVSAPKSKSSIRSARLREDLVAAHLAPALARRDRRVTRSTSLSVSRSACGAGSPWRRPARARAISASNSSRSSCWKPSDSAWSGRWCVSIISPSAPAASAARAHGSRMSFRPSAWLTSTMTGSEVSCLSSGIAEMSSVLRVQRSKVRMPRSHSTTASLPSDRMYSAESSSSSRVAMKPRLSSTGLPSRPIAFSSSVLYMLRAPTCSMSAYSATRSSVAGVEHLGHGGEPVAVGDASRRIFSPSSRSPWNV